MNDELPDKIYLNAEQWERLMEILNKPPEPNEALKRLFEESHSSNEETE